MPFNMSVTIASERTGDAGKHRVHHDEADAQVGAGKRRAGIKAEPAEGQDERAEARPSARCVPASPAACPANRTCRCAGR